MPRHERKLGNGWLGKIQRRQKMAANCFWTISVLMLLVVATVTDILSVSKVLAATSTAQPQQQKDNSKTMAEERSIQQMLLSIEEKMRSMDNRLGRLEIKLNSQLMAKTQVDVGTTNCVNISAVANDASTPTNSSGQVSNAGTLLEQLETKLDGVEQRLTASVDEATHRATKAEESVSRLAALSTLKLEHIEEIGLSVRDHLRDELFAFLATNFQDLKEEVATVATGRGWQDERSADMDTDSLSAGIDTSVGGNNSAADTDDKVDRGWSRDHHQSAFYLANQHQTSQTQAFGQPDWHNASEKIAGALRSGEKKIQDLDSDIKIYTRKVLNTYQELLKETKEMEVYLHEVMLNNNYTRVAIREGFRKLYQQMKPVSNLEEQLESLGKKVLEIGNTVDYSFASLLVAQNTFITSCHRIQQQEPHIETKIYQLLQRLVHESDNRVSNQTFHVNETFWNTFETHRKDVGRALHDLVWTVITVGNQTAQDLRETIKSWQRAEARDDKRCSQSAELQTDVVRPLPVDMHTNNSSSDAINDST